MFDEFDEDEQPLSALDRALAEAGATRSTLRAISSRALLQLPNEVGSSAYGGEVIPVSTPAVKRWKRQYEKQNGSIPRDERGRSYVVHHERPLADGGLDSPENFELMPADAHRAHHQEAGDFSRWAKRPGRAKAFGGRVARGLGPLQLIPNITGILSGRIRTDSRDNFWSDLLGMPSEKDQRREIERQQRQLNPKWRWGDPFQA